MRSYPREVLREGLTRRSYANPFFYGRLMNRWSITRKLYAEAFRGDSGNFFRFSIRGRSSASLTRRSSTGTLRGATFQWQMLGQTGPSAEAFREGLTRVFFLMEFFFNTSL